MLFGSREIVSPQMEPQGVKRVLCIGDSMTYGQGVKYDETMPRQLESLLNKTFLSLSFEVINAGVCGHSFFHSLYRTEPLVSIYKPDLLILPVCYNDTDFPGVDHSQHTFEDHIRDMWNEEGEYFPHFLQALDKFDTLVKKLETPCLIVYYYYLPLMHSYSPAEILKKHCAQRAFDYLDLSPVFGDPLKTKDLLHLRASEVDYHPSPQAHGIAASRILKEVIKNQYFSEPDFVDETDILEDIHRLVVKTLKTSTNPITALDWSIETLKAKRASRRRDKIPKEKSLNNSHYDSILQGFETSYQIWVQALKLRSMVDKLMSDAGLWYKATYVCQDMMDWRTKAVALLESQWMGELKTPKSLIRSNSSVSEADLVPIGEVHFSGIEELNRSLTFLQRSATNTCNFDHLNHKLLHTSGDLKRISNIYFTMQDLYDQAIVYFNDLKRLTNTQSISTTIVELNKSLEVTNTVLIELTNKLRGYKHSSFNTARKYVTIEFDLHTPKSAGGSVRVTIQSYLPSFFYFEFSILRKQTHQKIQIKAPLFFRAKIDIYYSGGAEEIEPENLFAFIEKPDDRPIRMRCTENQFSSDEIFIYS
ncbi:MAG: SGNH/GDSL hydrolase family protein [Gammaproteobacteria bacterium]|nr:SGNH/GDSL hydrolase family protein [Gammaproteobacteria bacterium]